MPSHELLGAKYHFLLWLLNFLGCPYYQPLAQGVNQGALGVVASLWSCHAHPLPLLHLVLIGRKSGVGVSPLELI